MATQVTGRRLNHANSEPHAGGAIAAAARWCAAARQLPGGPPLLAFGTDSTARVLIGERRSLCWRRSAQPGSGIEWLWEQVAAFLARPGFVAGYLGFDAVWPDGINRRAGEDGALVPALHLFEPEAVLGIDVGAAGLRSSVLQDSGVFSTLVPGTVDAGRAVGLRSVDRDPQEFRRSVKRVLEAIRRGEAQRLTVARRVDLPDDIDPLASFASPPPDSGGLDRSFYLRTPALELAGHSPELLGAGSRERFACYKLSGTGPRGDSPGQDAALRSALLADPKVLQEHALSIEATRAALANVGTVSAGSLKLVERRGLRHLLTPLTVESRPEAGLAAILRALLPAGAQPRNDGLRLLDTLEPASRGAYYGLIGLRVPDGQFEFSQVLRTVFRDGSGPHTWVGAAVTEGSTAEGECEETRLKLDDVTAIRRRQPA